MWALKIAVVALLMLQGAIPGDDPENAAPEPGQPAHCDNKLATEAAHRCECGRAMQKCSIPGEPPANVTMDRKCKTYCRAQHCLCRSSHCSG
jgi:hypothetical protein